MTTWRERVQPIADKCQVAHAVDAELAFGSMASRDLGKLLVEMADRLDAINAEARAMAALRLGFRE